MAAWEIVEQGAALRRARRPFALATVVRRERPASAQPGDQALITEDGRLRGWIGGSCAEPLIVREGLHALREERSCLVTLGPPGTPTGARREGAIAYPMTCHSGGTLEIFVDPYLPEPRVILVGQAPVAEALVALAATAGFEVVVCTPEAEAARFPLAAQVLPALDPAAAPLDRRTYVVVATHGQADEEALALALRGEACYVALVSSHKRAAACRESLLAMGLTPEQVARLKAPAGLDIGAVTAPEIAVSILAEMVCYRRSAAAHSQPGTQAAPPMELSAVDPVCCMQVEIGPATPSMNYRGHTYYFCCAGCRGQFERDPQRYLAPAAGESS